MSGLPALITSGLGWHPAAGPIPEFIWIGGSSPLCGTFIVLVGLSVLLFCLRVREAMLFFASSARPCVCVRACVYLGCFVFYCASPAHAWGFVMVWVVCPHAVTQKTLISQEECVQGRRANPSPRGVWETVNRFPSWCLIFILSCDWRTVKQRQQRLMELNKTTDMFVMFVFVVFLILQLLVAKTYRLDLTIKIWTRMWFLIHIIQWCIWTKGFFYCYFYFICCILVYSKMKNNVFSINQQYQSQGAGAPPPSTHLSNHL